MLAPALRNTCLAALAALALAPTRAVALDDLTTPNSSIEARSLLDYLKSIEGNHILSGQQETSWDLNREEEDVNYIFQNTGKKPAVRGFDFLEYVYSPSVRAKQDATPRAIQWAQNGGIVTFCCHMFMDLNSTNGTPQFYVPSANKGTGTNFDIRQAVIDGTPENTEMLAKFDIIAEELTKLRDAHVPVIWRPFHECSGGWFWWGAHGPDAFIKAYRMMHDRFTKKWGLNNLIWEYNPTDSTTNMKSWYPGDDVVDMITLDIYPNAGTHPSYAAQSKQMNDFKGGRKIVALSENGAIPDIDDLFNNGGLWTYFCTWNGFENDTTQNSVSFLKTVYAHEKVITLDELPNPYHRLDAAPVVLIPPVDVSTSTGARVAFSVVAQSPVDATYQWSKDGVAIAGATDASYTVANATAADNGAYSATVTNSFGTVTSAAGHLTVDASTYTPRTAQLYNVSARCNVGTGANVLIAGFYVGGTGAKKLLIRAIGPTLGAAPFNLPGVLANPMIELTKLDGTLLAKNNDWNDDATIAAAATSVYATPFVAGSEDAALIVTLPAGNSYTATVKGYGDTTGIATVEVWDLDPNSTARLINLSARAQVGTGAQAMFAGFIVNGSTNLPVLVRAAGPNLTRFGVPNALPNPQIALVRQSDAVQLAFNDNWESDDAPAVNAAVTSSSASPFEAGSKDAALVKTVAPGPYNPTVSDPSGASGVAIAEVYELQP